MTSEICIMNRLAAVLAADSATTVTQWGERGREERYFKGANKIFQISNHHPVGMMIFDSADILKVPWEVVVKQFRIALGNKSFNNLRGYADEFFSYLNEDLRLFPSAVQKETFLSAARSAAMRILFRAKSQNGADKAERQAEIDAAVVTRRAEVEAMPLNPCIKPETVRETIASWLDDLLKMIEEWRSPLGNMGEIYPTDLNKFAETGMVEAFKMPGEYIGKTGIVLAGFGNHDVFPSMIEYLSSGMVNGTHVSTEISNAKIDHETPAWLSAFAQTSMSDTFSLGLSQDIYSSLTQSLTEGLHAFAEEIARESGGDITQVADLAASIEKAISGISESVLDKARREHAYPLRRVLGVLPVDEMAELAETLINLQSLKEKVTKPSETVGGPIDVAVITKSEGLVWVKRKHFFDAAINSRYFQRQAAVYR
jgi:hypothetical protein